MYAVFLFLIQVTRKARLVLHFAVLSAILPGFVFVLLHDAFKFFLHNRCA